MSAAHEDGVVDALKKNCVHIIAESWGMDNFAEQESATVQKTRTMRQGQCSSCRKAFTKDKMESSCAQGTGKTAFLNKQQYVHCDATDSGCSDNTKIPLRSPKKKQHQHRMKLPVNRNRRNVSSIPTLQRVMRL